MGVDTWLEMKWLAETNAGRRMGVRETVWVARYKAGWVFRYECGKKTQHS